MLKTACILIPKNESEESLRISVMSRHTLSDGVTPDERITNDLFDEFMPELAPPPKLVGDYYKRGLSWEEYEVQYKIYLRAIGDVVLKLAQRACDEDITVECIEEEPDFCHRRLLAETCKELVPDLVIEIK